MNININSIRYGRKNKGKEILLEKSSYYFVEIHNVIFTTFLTSSSFFVQNDKWFLSSNFLMPFKFSFTKLNFPT